MAPELEDNVLGWVQSEDRAMLASVRKQVCGAHQVDIAPETQDIHGLH